MPKQANDGNPYNLDKFRRPRESAESIPRPTEPEPLLPPRKESEPGKRRKKILVYDKLLSIKISTADYEKLQAMAIDDGGTIAAYLRRIIKKHLKERR